MFRSLRGARRLALHAPFATVLLVGSLAALGSPGWALAGSSASLPTWLSSACATDGSATASSADCVPTGSSVDLDAFPSSHCAGAIVCDATWSQLRNRGVDSSSMRADFEAAASAEVGSSSTRARATGFSGYFATNDFYLADATASVCKGTVNYNGHCAWLYNHWQQYSGGLPKPSASTTVFPARSGNNQPSDHWVASVGPLPNADWSSSSPSLNHFHWGWQNGSFSGYAATTDPLYDPGFWPLDPWSVWSGGSRTGSARCCFIVHGGSGAHDFWSAPTAGCIRMPQPAITSLRNLWGNYTDNKRMAPGPDVGVHYRAP